MNYKFEYVEEITNDEGLTEYIYVNELYELRVNQKDFHINYRYESERYDQIVTSDDDEEAVKQMLRYVFTSAVPHTFGKLLKTNGRDNIRSGYYGLTKIVKFEDMLTSGQQWVDLYYTILEADKIVRKHFPGYCLVQSDEDKQKLEDLYQEKMRAYHEEEDRLRLEWWHSLGFDENTTLPAEEYEKYCNMYGDYLHKHRTIKRLAKWKLEI